MSLSTLRIASPRGPFLTQLVNAVLLRRDLYESVAADASATRPAIAVVCLAAVLPHLLGSTGLMQVFIDEGLATWGPIFIMLFAIVRWLLFATIQFGVAKLFAGVPVEFKRLLRCLGYAQAPELLSIIPAAAGEPWSAWLRLAVGLWLFAATAVAVRAALGVSTRRALALSALGFGLHLAIGLFADT